FFAVYYGCTGEKESAAKTRARQAYRRHYGETIMEGYILMEHWNDGHFNLRPALLLLYFDSVIISRLLLALCAQVNDLTNRYTYYTTIRKSHEDA
ncbi:hypothetical protein PENTCL1PPCAC_16957, partial [Pristionchus entomophagus]